MTQRSFRQADVTRAIKAIVAAGLNVSRVDIAIDGKASIVIGPAEASIHEEPNPWDEVLQPDWRDSSPLYRPELAKPKRKPRRYGDEAWDKSD